MKNTMRVIEIKVNGEWKETEDLNMVCLDEKTYDIEEIEDIRLVDKE